MRVGLRQFMCLPHGNSTNPGSKGSLKPKQPLHIPFGWGGEVVDKNY
jgi:hypothetical protein